MRQLTTSVNDLAQLMKDLSVLVIDQVLSFIKILKKKLIFLLLFYCFFNFFWVVKMKLNFEISGDSGGQNRLQHSKSGGKCGERCKATR